MLAVESDGQVVGYVRQESVYEDAARMVQGQIIYTGNEEQWTLEPSFTISTARSSRVATARRWRRDPDQFR